MSFARHCLLPEHIRLILLDDASTDGSFAICEQYQKQYPKQILVKHYDTNQGVSALRNEGVRIAGEMGDELITFLDSDDKLADDAMEKAKMYLNHMRMFRLRLLL